MKTKILYIVYKTRYMLLGSFSTFDNLRVNTTTHEENWLREKMIPYSIGILHMTEDEYNYNYTITNEEQLTRLLNTAIRANKLNSHCKFIHTSNNRRYHPRIAAWIFINGDLTYITSLEQMIPAILSQGMCNVKIQFAGMYPFVAQIVFNDYVIYTINEPTIMSNLPRLAAFCNSTPGKSAIVKLFNNGHLTKNYTYGVNSDLSPTAPIFVPSIGGEQTFLAWRFITPGPNNSQ